MTGAQRWKAKRKFEVTALQVTPTNRDECRALLGGRLAGLQDGWYVVEEPILGEYIVVPPERFRELFEAPADQMCKCGHMSFAHHPGLDPRYTRCSAKAFVGDTGLRELCSCVIGPKRTKALAGARS